MERPGSKKGARTAKNTSPPQESSSPAPPPPPDAPSQGASRPRAGKGKGVRGSGLRGDDSDEISLASSGSGDRNQGADDDPAPRARSLSFDDLYALAPAQDGLTIESKFAFQPLEGAEQQGVKKSASVDDLYALVEDALQDPAFQDEYGDDISEDTATVQSMPVGGQRGKQASAKRRPASEGQEVQDDFPDDPELYGPPSSKYEEEANTPAERLFGKRRAQELRQRIMRQREVSPQVAEDALNAATAAMMGSESSETIEFVTWFSVWGLIMFYLLFYSSYGPMLWKFLYGPMGVVLALPFGFAVLFWLVAYVFTDNDD